MCVCVCECVCVCVCVCVSVCVCVCVCVVSATVKRPVLPPCAVDGHSRNPLYYYYYYYYYYDDDDEPKCNILYLRIPTSPPLPPFSLSLISLTVSCGREAAR